DDLCCIEDNDNGKKAQYEQCDAYKGMDEIPQGKGRNGQCNNGHHVNQAKAEGGAQSFAPFVSYQLGRTSKSRYGTEVFLGDHGHDKESGDTPDNADETGDDLTDASKVIL